MLRLTVPPGTELPELNETVNCCAKAGLAITDRRSNALDSNLRALITPRNFKTHLQELTDLL